MEAAQKIKQPGAACAKFLNQVSRTLEVLMDDKELEKFVEEMYG